MSKWRRIRSLPIRNDDYEIWLTRMTRTADLARVSISIETIGGSGDVGWAQVVTDVTVCMMRATRSCLAWNVRKKCIRTRFLQTATPLPDFRF